MPGVADCVALIVAGGRGERFGADVPKQYHALAGQPVLPSHIQVTRAKNLAKLRSDAALLERLRELLEA